ncbi:MAG: hypothetical protein H7A08_01260 [Oceanospirillaceae bacterium]|nr:hypothetical protein [Oceanospirillaceae bacterium]MCP5350588.1 hypothetical protein [Oceanospirillaceae bacterium]
MNMQTSFKQKANKKDVLAEFTLNDGSRVQLPACQISVRGLVLSCSPEELRSLHPISEGQLNRFEPMNIAVQMSAGATKGYSFEAQGQISSIRRVSQVEYAVSVGFSNILHEGYKDIAKFLSQKS